MWTGLFVVITTKICKGFLLYDVQFEAIPYIYNRVDASRQQTRADEV